MVAGVSMASFRGISLSLFLVFGTASAARNHSEPKDPVLPDVLRPPKEQVLLLRMHGRGDATYTCLSVANKSVWRFKGPAVQLFSENGEPLARHFAGHTWEANDGSRLVTKALVAIPSPDPASIPWRLATVISGGGEGMLTPVASILRLNTKGGQAPAEGCDSKQENTEIRVPFEADFYFYGSPQSVSK
jgi:hypothetical protein